MGLQVELLCWKGKVTYGSAFLFFSSAISAVWVLIKDKVRGEHVIFLAC